MSHCKRTTVFFAAGSSTWKSEIKVRKSDVSGVWYGETGYMIGKKLSRRYIAAATAVPPVMAHATVVFVGNR